MTKTVAKTSRLYTKCNLIKFDQDHGFEREFGSRQTKLFYVPFK